MKFVRTVKDNLGDILLSMTLALLPLSISLTNIFLVALIVWWLLTLSPTYFREQWRIHRTGIIISIAPFLFMSVTLIYTPEPKTGLHSIEKYLTLFILPLVMATARLRRSADFFPQVFSSVITAMCVICMGWGLYRFYFEAPEAIHPTGDFITRIPTRWNTLTNSNLLLPFSVNPIYFSLYISFAQVVIVFKRGMPAVVRVMLFVFLMIFQILLSSRIGLAAAALAGIGGIFLIPASFRRYVLAGASATIVIFAITFMINPVLQKRYSGDLKSWRIPQTLSGWNAVNLRTAIWTCSGRVFEESPLLGKGVAGAGSRREACYRTYSFYGKFGRDFNSHNQYIEYALTGGLVLTGLFLLQLVYSFRHSIQTRNQVQFCFLIIVAVVALGESILEAHKGIVFFSCFNSLFLFKAPAATHA